MARALVEIIDQLLALGDEFARDLISEFFNPRGAC